MSSSFCFLLPIYYGYHRPPRQGQRGETKGRGTGARPPGAQPKSWAAEGAVARRGMPGYPLVNIEKTMENGD